MERGDSNYSVLAQFSSWPERLRLSTSARAQREKRGCLANPDGCCNLTFEVLVFI